MSEFAGKTILITGATGLIGSNLVDRFMSMGDTTVIALGRNEDKLKSGFADYLDNPRFICAIQDVCQPLCLPDSIMVDYVFHTAGATTSNVINERPLEVIDANLIGTRNCLELLRAQKGKGVSGRLILFSSVTVYGNSFDEDQEVSEEDTHFAPLLDNPYAVYAETKRMSEVLALACSRQYGVDVVMVRLSTVYGPARFYPDSAIYEFIQRALKGEDIILRNSALPRRDNIYIDDALNGLIAVCTKGKSGEVYHISSNGELGNFAAVNEIAEIIAETVNRMYGKMVSVQYETRANSQRKPGVILDNRKTMTLGWYIQTGLSQGIKKTVEKISGI